jgi:hypothetical protein
MTFMRPFCASHERIVQAIHAGVQQWIVVNFSSGCEVGDTLARRLAFGPAVREALRYTFERWDGQRRVVGAVAAIVRDRTTRTLFSGDLFTQPGVGERPIVEDDILRPSEAFRRQMDYYAHSRGTRRHLDKLAALEPEYLACMHGSAGEETAARSCVSLRRSSSAPEAGRGASARKRPRCAVLGAAVTVPAGCRSSPCR